jgi:hypothetical protein
MQPREEETLLRAINPEMHAHIEKRLAPDFTPHSLKAQELIVQHYINLLIERLEDCIGDGPYDQNETIDIAAWFQFVTFDIFGELGPGESFNCLVHARYYFGLNFSSLASRLPLSWPRSNTIC